MQSVIKPFIFFAFLLFATVGADLYCPKPYPPKYGYLSFGQKHEYKAGSVIIFKCNRGYRLVGQSVIRCLFIRNRAYWSYKFPVCTKIIISLPVCPKLQDPRYGDVSLTGVKIGAKATYTCDQGFTLNGNAVRTCQFNGQWSGNEPNCRRVITCNKLFDPRNGNVDLTGLAIGSKATYSCNGGFKLQGNEVRKCQSNGHWSGSQPSCQKIIITCPKLQDPRNGDVDLSGIQVGSKATYSCDQGFQLRGDRKRKCQSNGQWSGSDAVCIKIITCQRLIDPNNGNVKLSGVSIGSKATYSCDRGFKLRGDRTRKCQSNGQWSGSDAVCIKIITCQRLSDPRNGDVELSGVNIGSKATYSCDQGFKLRGNKVRKCQSNGQWSGSDGVCIKIRVTCEYLDDPQNGDVQVSGVNVGSKARYSCARGFRLVGDSKRKCQSNGQWSGREPFCKKNVQVQCQHLPDPQYGYVRITSLSVGSVARYSCKNGYFLQGASKLKCLSTGQWSKHPPVCIYKKYH